VHDHAIVGVGPERAAGATFVPVRAEHEVVDDELAAAGEQVRQRLLAVRAIKYIGLLDLDPGQLAALSGELIAQPSEFLLFGQEALAGGEPFLVGHYLVHRSAPFSCTQAHRTDATGGR
jgi:hypothetical protein